MLNKINNKQFTLEFYESIVKKYDLSNVWNVLIKFLKEKGVKFFSEKVVDFYEIGRLYEIGLAIKNKYLKKETGKYYTPKDVSQLMAKLLIENSTLTSIVDAGCGCGNLIIELLSQIKEKNPNHFDEIKKNIYLYDLDKTALLICVARLSTYFNIDDSIIHTNQEDFLSKKVIIPPNAFVISNPPYSKIRDIDDNWEYKEAIFQSKDLYIGFIEKIICNSKKAVIVSPQSYIVGKKFSKIREILYKNGNGEIYSFDNVPGTLFNGRKEGIFNTNSANGVRASILVFNRSNIKGYRLTHLIRFKTYERDLVINFDYIKNQLGKKIQNLSRPLKVFKELEDFVYSINNNKTIKDLLELDKYKQKEKLCINVNSSARYFIVGSITKMCRNGMYSLYAKDKNSFYQLYTLINSSYVYLWWRMLDGGILVSRNLILDIPLPQNNFMCNDVISYCEKMMKEENKYLVYKKNAGKFQESIKFPDQYRERLNELMFGKYPFYLIHSNKEII